MDKWEAHYNRFFVPIHGETAGTSHLRFGTHDGVFEHGFAGRSGPSTSAGYYLAPDDPTYGEDDDHTESTFDDPDMVIFLLLEAPPLFSSLCLSLCLSLSLSLSLCLSHGACLCLTLVYTHTHTHTHTTLY